MQTTLDNFSGNPRVYARNQDTDTRRWRYLGAGSFSEVYLHTPTQRVVKITVYKDLATQVYYEYLLNNKPNNPYFPEIYKVHYTNNYMVFYMEHLRQAYYYDDISDNNYSWELGLSTNRAANDFCSFEYKANNPILQNAIETIWLLKHESRLFQFDFEMRNLLFRGPDQPVFADPIFASARNARHYGYSQRFIYDTESPFEKWTTS